MKARPGRTVDCNPNVKIEISTEMVDTKGKLIFTLLREMCRAAWFFIDDYKLGKGQSFKFWARKATNAFYVLDVSKYPPVFYPHKWECKNCFNSCQKYFGDDDQRNRATCNKCRSQLEYVGRCDYSDTSDKNTLHQYFYAKGSGK